MITTVTFNPAIDKTAQVDQLIPGGLNRLKNVRQDAGGKGINVSKTLKAAGQDSTAAGLIGGAAGDYIRKRMEELGIAHAFVRVDGDTRTNLKVLDAQMNLTELNEAGPYCTQKDLDRLMDLLSAREGILVLCGNTGPGVPHTVYRTLTERAHENGLRVILDADGELFQEGIKAHPDVIKPNRFELAQYFGKSEDELDAQTMISLARTFIQEGVRLVVISMGIEGSLFVTEERALLAPALKIPFQSAVGAGDAMVAGLAYGMEHDLSLEETLVLAVALSAGACMTEGTQPADAETVEKLKKEVTWEEK